MDKGNRAWEEGDKFGVRGNIDGREHRFIDGEYGGVDGDKFGGEVGESVIVSVMIREVNKEI